jgi:S-adenosylmethionine hydrolase
MIYLVTDFGREGPYLGQVHAVITRLAPAVPVIELFSDLPPFDPQAAAYLLPAYTCQARAARVQPGDVVLAVVDPGVGSTRACIALRADGVWYVGPDNGLFSQVVRRATSTSAWRLPVPDDASASFHGRDVFAAAAAQLAGGQPLIGHEAVDARTLDRPEWPDDLAAIVYIDRYGNAMTGLRVAIDPDVSVLQVESLRLPRKRTFGEATLGEAFFYANANGLWEIAVNGGSAAVQLGLRLGTRVLRHM